MGTESFARLRVGIGKPTGGTISHVLGDFAHAEQQHLDLILDAAADAVELWADKGPDVVANKWNGWKPPIEEPKPPKPLKATAQPELKAGDAGSGAPAQPQADADGVVRTKTGWRKLLPDILGGRGKDEA
jgi:hypothetical protein